LFRLWLSVGLAVLPVLFLGRIFCAWICPVTLTRGGVKSNGETSHRNQQESEQQIPSVPQTLRASGPVHARRRAWASYSSYGVLGASLLSSLLFGFPVFCLICPIGLMFGSLFAVMRLFGARQPSLELLLFPALLVTEVVILKSWCRSLCPLGALLRIIGGHTRILRPRIEKEHCLVTRGIACSVCRKACPERIDLLEENGGAELSSCTRCLECHQRCPTKAIRMPPL
jgi:ferredoxin-type protein NapH